MDDLQRQFAALDAVPMPDIRAEIDRRVQMDPTATVRVVGARQAAAGRPVLVLTPQVALLLAALLVTVALGGIVAGAWWNTTTPPAVVDPNPPLTAPPSPAPTATATATAGVTFDCAAAQASAAIRTDRWTSGPAPAAPRAGWIAVWGAAAHPELVLVNALTGETCSLITFSDFDAPPGVATPEGLRDWIPARGQLAWSPDGSALAMIVVDAKPCAETGGLACNPRYALYVWSHLGLAGPVIEVEEPSYLHVPSWSPDGSLLAVGESTGTIPGASDPASAWIIAGDGSEPREVRAGCDACFGSSVHWSPSGEQIAFRTWSNQDNGESMGIAAGNVDADVIPLLAGTNGGDSLLGWATDESLWVVPFSNTVPIDVPDGAGRLAEVPLDPRIARVDHGYLPSGAGVIPGGAISPDGAHIIQAVERPRALVSDLMLADFPSGKAKRLVEALPLLSLSPAWWSPDGLTVGYLVDVQGPDQGIWLIDVDGTDNRKLVGAPFVIGRDAYGGDATLLRVWQPRS